VYKHCVYDLCNCFTVKTKLLTTCRPNKLRAPSENMIYLDALLKY